MREQPKAAAPRILGGAAEGRPAPVGAGGARSGGSGGREPPRKANFPKVCYARIAVAPFQRNPVPGNFGRRSFGGHCIIWRDVQPTTAALLTIGVSQFSDVIYSCLGKRGAGPDEKFSSRVF